jgi:hypothetical protein
VNRRAAYILAALLVVLAALAFFGNAPVDTSSSLNEPLVADFRAAVNDIDHVEIRGAGNSVLVELLREGDVWTVAQRDGYPADISKLREALLAISESRIVEPKTANPDLHDRLGVEDIERSDAGGIALALTGGDVELPVLIFGDTENTDYRYVRLADDSQSYLIDHNPDLPDDPAEWVTPLVLDIEGLRIQRIEIRHANGDTLTLSKDSMDQSNFDVANIPEGRELQYPGVANVTGNVLRDLRLEDVASTDGEEFVPDVTTTFYTFDGLAIMAQGRLIDEEGWLVFSANVSEAAPPPSETDDSAIDVELESITDPADEAAEINARLGGWRYRIPSYKYNQMTRRIDDLLQTAEEDDE